MNKPIIPNPTPEQMNNAMVTYSVGKMQAHRIAKWWNVVEVLENSPTIDEPLRSILRYILDELKKH